MRIATVEDYIRDNGEDDIGDNWNGRDRRIIHAKFPHVVVVECDYPELNNAHRWCWTQFGPDDGRCMCALEYPMCPIILKTEQLIIKNVSGVESTVKRYDFVDPHDHVGEWSYFWFGKTDYDHGYCEFCFSTADQLQRFVAQVPHIDWGENYPSLRKEKNQ